MDARIDIQRHAFGGGEMEEGRAMAVLRFRGGAWLSAAALLNHLGVIILTRRAFGVPGGQVGDRYPGADRGPKVRRACRHDERHVSAAGATDEIDAMSINAGVGLGVFHRVDDVL